VYGDKSIREFSVIVLKWKRGKKKSAKRGQIRDGIRSVKTFRESVRFVKFHLEEVGKKRTFPTVIAYDIRR